MSRNIADLKEQARARAESALSDLKALGVKCAVTSTLRTEAEQKALYAQGRESLTTVNALRDRAMLYSITDKENSYTVTNCDGVTKKSPHQSGRALDVVPVESGRAVWPDAEDKRWKEISTAFKKHGFTWGGDWADFPDYPHYQLGAV